jgi:predicted nucleic acid-binding protein
VIAYLDSSIVVRLTLSSHGGLRQWPRLKHLVTSRLTEVECFRVLDAKRLAENTPGEMVASAAVAIQGFMQRCAVVELSPEIFARAKGAFPTRLGTLDALHVSAALLWQQWHEPKLVFATHDRQQGTAARALGLPVIGL